MAGPRPGARAGKLPPSNSKFFCRDGAPTKVGSQLPACQDRKLIELLDSHPTSKLHQLRGLLSEEMATGSLTDYPWLFKNYQAI